MVKQSLPRLRVADEWLATRERIVTEAASLELTGHHTPGAVPAVFDVDAEAYVIAIEAAPAHWRPWKDALLAGDADARVAARLGEILAAWHERTADDDEVRARFDDYDAFEQLRVDPYYRTVARRHPDLAPRIQQTIDAMASSRSCLVHADFSPKNVLVGADGVWVIDHECAHVGDPAFDVAFLLDHLLLKTIHRPAFETGVSRLRGGIRRGVRQPAARRDSAPRLPAARTSRWQVAGRVPRRRRTGARAHDGDPADPRAADPIPLDAWTLLDQAGSR